jgi:UDP-N-acetylglucosamine acyltransferase
VTASAIHPTALIDPRARLDAGVTVGAYAVIGPDVELGAGTRVGPHCLIQGPARIGRDNHFVAHCSIGGQPQDKKYAGEPTRLEMGDRNTFFEFSTVSRGTAQDTGITRVGNDGWFMATTHIAHDCVVGDHVILANCATLAGHVHVGAWAILGGFTKVHQFCRIGAHAFCGMNVDLAQDVPPYVMIAGTPAAPRGINAEGLRRRGFTPEQSRNIKNAYRIIYRAELRLEQAVEELRALASTQAELAPLVEFLAQSERGLVR